RNPPSRPSGLRSRQSRRAMGWSRARIANWIEVSGEQPSSCRSSSPLDVQGSFEDGMLGRLLGAHLRNDMLVMNDIEPVTETDQFQRFPREYNDRATGIRIIPKQLVKRALRTNPG